MKAAWYERSGKASEVLQVGTQAKPTPQPGEVLVRIHASGVNPSDTKARNGLRSRNAGYAKVIPHQDGAGVIEAVGKDVDPGRVGERVWIYEAQLGRPFGCAAQYTAVPDANAVALPRHTSYEEGASLGVPALTAHYCVAADGPIQGKTVLVHGGAGAVGFYAIQFAKLAQATVISTISTPEQAQIAKRAGADHLIFRKSENIKDRIADITQAEDGRGIDRIIDVAFGANLQTNIAVLKQNGVIATYASDQVATPQIPFHDLLALNATIRYVLVYRMSRADHQRSIQAVTDALLAQQLKHHIAARFSLDQIVQAHEAVEAGSPGGKVMLVID